MSQRLWLTVAAWLLVLTVPAGAVGTVTQAHYSVGNVRKVVFTVTADAADGSIPATAITVPLEGRLLKIVTDPGATAPTDNYDITLVDQYGQDVLQGVGANRDTVNTEAVPVVYSGTALHPVVDESDVLTLTVANNAVNSATITIVLYVALGA